MSKITLGIAVVALLGGAAACDGSESAAEQSSGDIASGDTSSGSGEPMGYGRGPGMGRGGGMGMGPGGGGRGPGRGMNRRMGPEDCPVAVASTSVEAQEIEGGAALAFLTEDEANVDELRRRVARMAEHHTERHGPGGGPPGRGMGHGRPEGVTPPPESNAEAVDVEGGARLEMRPTDPDALDSLRSHVTQAAERMQGGQCPWMQAGAGSGAAPRSP